MDEIKKINNNFILIDKRLNNYIDMKKDELKKLIAEVAREEMSNEPDLEIGHDDEPKMIQSSVYEIANYAIKLYKLLEEFDSMDRKVNFPHWWQEKIVIAREEIGSATHYLETEMRED